MAGLHSCSGRDSFVAAVNAQVVTALTSDGKLVLVTQQQVIAGVVPLIACGVSTRVHKKESEANKRFYAAVADQERRRQQAAFVVEYGSAEQIAEQGARNRMSFAGQPKFIPRI